MRIAVSKYDPTTDAAPRLVEGDVEHHEMMSVLEALVDFSNTVEHVNFEYSCKERQCGRCGVMFDGTPCLACVTPIDDGEHTIEPLAGFPVLRDLVVDRGAYDDNVTAAMNRIRIEDCTSEESQAVDFPADVRERIYSMEWCCRCGVCDAGCPAKRDYPDEFAGPAVMLALGYRHLDPFDQGDRVLEAVNAGLFRCYMCGNCDNVCPQDDIAHVELWQTLRDAAGERGLVPRYAQ